jgi:hypothetical protein
MNITIRIVIMMPNPQKGKYRLPIIMPESVEPNTMNKRRMANMAITRAEMASPSVRDGLRFMRLLVSRS